MQRFNESLLKAIPIPVFYKDVEGVSSAATRPSPRSPASARPSCWANGWTRSSPRWPTNTPSATWSAAQQAAAIFRAHPVRSQRPPLSGAQLRIFYDHQGEVAGIIGALVDITHIKESEQQQRTLLFQTIAALSSAIAHKRSRHRGPRAACARSRTGHRPASATFPRTPRRAGPRRHGAQHRPVADPGGDPHPPPRTEGGGVRAHQAAPAGGL